MKKLLIGFLILFVLYLGYIIIPFFINDCDCENKNTIIGSYKNVRKDSINIEHLYIYSDSSYIHLLSYDSIQFVNSDKWKILDEQAELQGWNDPDIIDVHNAKEYLNFIPLKNICQKFPKYFGGNCYDHYKYGCVFCIFFDEFNSFYRRSTIDNQIVDLKNIPTLFYSKADSISFSNTIKKNNIEILNKNAEIKVW
jgi:hypothetical protein